MRILAAWFRTDLVKDMILTQQEVDEMHDNEVIVAKYRVALGRKLS